MASSSSLHRAVLEGDIGLVRDILTDRASPNSFDKGGKWTPLHLAAGHGHLGIVEVLLSGRANVSIGDGDGRTPVDWAASAAHRQIEQVLSRHMCLTNLASSTTSPLHGGLAEPVAVAASTARNPCPIKPSTRQANATYPDFDQSSQSYEWSCRELGQRLAATAHREGVLAHQFLLLQEENRCLWHTQRVGSLGGLVREDRNPPMSHNLHLRVAVLEQELLHQNTGLRQEDRVWAATARLGATTESQSLEAELPTKSINQIKQEVVALKQELETANREHQEVSLAESQCTSEVEALRSSLTAAAASKERLLERFSEEESDFARSANRVRCITEEAASEMEVLRKELKAAKSFETDEASLCATVKRQYAQEEEEAKALQVLVTSLRDELTSAHEEANQANARAAAAARAWGR
eukprot:CAMPEP_0206589208 /NCGR_PEP_ID=MMETSP0325_2-20121206/38773_1 /ASSEMBLY_ACC=CAM_ASM_000347 /TAXON_ID=2866 /ORGANISM="Crypthecodinium cohnii, Strain Seligo" /LENGTH=410 /DNA_ID=CAMNT_0054097697 /DNA_START=113 /DNA_END=1345 /DNA_ORIENTATION=+